MEAFRRPCGKLPALDAGFLALVGFVLGMSATPTFAAIHQGGDYLLASPSLAIDFVSMAEGNIGNTAFVFTVTMSKASASDVRVGVQTSDGSATVANNDYTSVSTTLVIPANSLSGTVEVFVTGDVVTESDENFFVELLNPENATLGSPIGMGTILNDDDDTPVLLSRFDAETLDDGIALRWQFGDAAEVQASWVERADAVAAPWIRLEAEPVVENELITVIDRNVEVGLEYRYRLMVTLASGETVELEQIAVTADLVKEFALGRVSPNPATGPAQIDYAIPRAANVQLTIMDIQGRVVAVLVDGPMKAGRHQAVWNGESRSGRAHPGVYFVRYQTPERAFSKRLILTR